MRIGCCCNMIAGLADGTGGEHAETLARLGFDYVELSLTHLAAYGEEEFNRLVRQLGHIGIGCRACNNFFPPSMRLTGELVDWDSISGYLERVIPQAARLGAEHIVFGSGPAKNVPEGFSFSKAKNQLVDLLRLIDPLATRHGLVIAIEPLRQAECNMINTVAEGIDLARRCNRASIKVLADLFHMVKENEDIARLKDAADCLTHVHIANPDGRLFPRATDHYDYQQFIRILQAMDYRGKISVEAYSTDVATDAADSLRFLQELMR